MRIIAGYGRNERRTEMRARVLAPIAAVLLSSGVARLDAQTPSASSAACLSTDEERRLEKSIGTADPASAPGQHMTATFYFQKSRDAGLAASEKRACLERMVAAEDRALAAEPTFFDALVYKNLALRELAAGEADKAVREPLIAEAAVPRDPAVPVRSAATPSPAQPQDSILA